jgi:hypothetical protein
MSAPWLAQRFAGDLAIAAAVRAADTKQTGCRPQSKSRSVRLGVRATFDESSSEFPGSVWAILHETRSGQEISKDIPRSFHGRELATLFRGHANSPFTNCP